MGRRKAGTLLSLELQILAATLPGGRFHGYELAQRVDGPRPLVGYGTIYKVLARLEGMGFLKSDWEDPEAALREGRPRRRLYEITAAGATAVADAPSARPALSHPVLSAR